MKTKIATLPLLCSSGSVGKQMPLLLCNTLSLFFLLASSAPLWPQSPSTDCPERIVYGDTTAASFLELQAEGLTRRIYLPDLAAQQVDSAYYRLFLPEFGTSWNSLSAMAFELLRYDGGDEGWKIRLQESRFYPLDCVRLPRELGTFGRPADSVYIGEGRLYLAFKVFGGPSGQDYLQGQLVTRRVLSFPTNPVTEGFFLDKEGERREITEAGAIYQPSGGELSLQYGDSAALSQVPLYRVSPGPGRYDEVTDYFEYKHVAYVFDTLNRSSLSLKVYDFSELEGASPSGGREKFKLSRGRLTARLRTDAVIWLPEASDLIVEPVK